MAIEDWKKSQIMLMPKSYARILPPLLLSYHTFNQFVFYLCPLPINNNKKTLPRRTKEASLSLNIIEFKIMFILS